MGWGLLFLGYVCVFVLGMNPMFYVFTALPGWLLCLLGLRALTAYCHSFRYAKWCAVAAGALCVWQTLSGAQTQLGLALPFLHDGVSAAVEWASILAVTLFHTLLALATKELCARVSLAKNGVRAMRNMVLVWMYGVAFAVMSLGRNEALTVSLYPFVLLLRLLWSVLFAVLLYSCYMHICPAGADQEEDAPKKSGIGWLDRLRRAAWEREQRAISADRRYHEQKSRQRLEKQLSRMSQKQRKKQEIKNNRK